MKLTPSELHQQALTAYYRILHLRPSKTYVHSVFFRRVLLVRLATQKKKYSLVSMEDVQEKNAEGVDHVQGKEKEGKGDVKMKEQDAMGNVLEKYVGSMRGDMGENDAFSKGDGREGGGEKTDEVGEKYAQGKGELGERERAGAGEEIVDDGETGAALMMYLVEHPQGRRELLIQWLYSLLAGCLSRQPVSSSSSSSSFEEQFYKIGCEHYNFVLLQYLKLILSKISNLEQIPSFQNTRTSSSLSLSVSSTHSSTSSASLNDQSERECTAEEVINTYLKLAEEIPLIPTDLFRYLEAISVLGDENGYVSASPCSFALFLPASPPP